MACLFPIRLKAPKPCFRGQFIDVPCGKCCECLRKRANDWFLRLKFEQKLWKFTYWIGLSYDNSTLVFDPKSDDLPRLSKRDVQLFFKRLRKSKVFGDKIRYFLVGEYGDKYLRPHYHLILFSDVEFTCQDGHDALMPIWELGFVTFDLVSDRRLRYVSKYSLKVANPFLEFPVPQFMLCSKRPYIGHNYVEMYKEHHLSSPSPLAVKFSPFNYSLPRIFKEKIYDTEEIKSSYRRVCIRDFICRSDRIYRRFFRDGQEQLYHQLYSPFRRQDEFIRSIFNSKRFNR